MSAQEIAIISGKGGTGKSSVSAAFAAFSSRIVLADCDVDAANLYLIFHPAHEEESVYTGGRYAVIDPAKCSQCGLCADYCRFDAIHYKKARYVVDEILCDGCQLCARICPHQAIDMLSNSNSRMFAGAFRYGHMVYGKLAPGEENSGKLVSLVRSKAKELARTHDHKQIIVDGPPGIGCPTISSITGVDRVVLVTEPSISGLHDLGRAVELVKKFSIPAYVIINKYDLNPDVAATIRNFCTSQHLTVAGSLPYDAAVTEAMVQCKAVNEYVPDAMISKLLQHCWDIVTNHTNYS